MRKLAICTMAGLVVLGIAGVGLAQHHAKNARGTSAITINGKTVSVEYGQPSLNGRTTDKLLGDLPAGSVWRMGADTSTTFKTDLDLTFGDVAIPAGEYSIWMQRQEDNSWKLLFDKKHGQWGAPSPEASEIFASAPLKSAKAGKSVDLVTLTLHKAGNGGTLTIQWGTLEEVGSFKAK